jgi:steroid delta-isomerase-like uncharacterized protein
MTTDDNKQAVRRFFEIVNSGDMTAFDDGLMTPGYRLHFDSMPEMDAAGASAFFGEFVAAFPDIDHQVQDQIAEGDKVATRIMVRGVNTGSFMGMPPTGRALDIGAINIHRFEDGQIAEQWVSSDSAATLIQLGVMPPPGA